jgi:hypothetical protein
VGPTPPEAWVFAFVKGARVSMAGKAGTAASPSDVAWADMGMASLVIVLGRDGRPFRTRERRQLSALARIADSRWVELVLRRSGAHAASPAIAELGAETSKTMATAAQAGPA